MVPMDLHVRASLVSCYATRLFHALAALAVHPVKEKILDFKMNARYPVCCAETLPKRGGIGLGRVKAVKT